MITLDRTRNTVIVTDYVGDTVIIPASYKDAAGTLIDLTGYTARMDLKARSGADVVLALDDASGIELGGAPNNIVITISAEQSATLGNGTFIGDFVLTSPLSTVDTLFQWVLTLRSRITT